MNTFINRNEKIKINELKSHGSGVGGGKERLRVEIIKAKKQKLIKKSIKK